MKKQILTEEFCKHIKSRIADECLYSEEVRGKALSLDEAWAVARQVRNQAVSQVRDVLTKIVVDTVLTAYANDLEE